jgi:hypothetical protein
MTKLPEGYRQIRKIDLMRNKKEAIIVNALAFAVMLVMIALGFFICPPLTELVLNVDKLISTALLIVGIVFYMILHELVHGAFMQAFSGEKPRYGYSGLYAYAGSDALFDRGQYLVIAFAPVVLLGLVLVVLNIAFYETNFWFFYIIQIINVSGAAGDFYVGAQIGRSSGAILIRDSGTDMTLFEPVRGR